MCKCKWFTRDLHAIYMAVDNNTHDTDLGLMMKW
jgi:hypothetical protein